MMSAARAAAGAVADPLPAGGIDRREHLPYAEFVRSYLKPLRPVVIAGAFDAWKALGKWTPRFFGEHYPDKELKLNSRTYRVAEFIDMVERPGDGRSAPYLFSLLLDEQFPELLD